MTQYARRILNGTLLWALIPALYFGCWYGCRYAGWTWPNALNIPGFFLISAAWPWGDVATQLSLFQSNMAGAKNPRPLILVATALGFGLNVSLLVTLVGFLINHATRRSTEVRSGSS